MAGETPQMKNTLASAEDRSNSSAEITDGGWPFCDGAPMVKVTCAASELIPTVQYGNATVGPAQITFFAAPDGRIFFDPEGLAQAISKGQAICEAAMAEERQTLHALLRSNTAAQRG